MLIAISLFVHVLSTLFGIFSMMASALFLIATAASLLVKNRKFKRNAVSFGISAMICIYSAFATVVVEHTYAYEQAGAHEYAWLVLPAIVLAISLVVLVNMRKSMGQDCRALSKKILGSTKLIDWIDNKMYGYGSKHGPKNHPKYTVSELKSSMANAKFAYKLSLLKQYPEKIHNISMKLEIIKINNLYDEVLDNEALNGNTNFQEHVTNLNSKMLAILENYVEVCKNKSRNRNAQGVESDLRGVAIKLQQYLQKQIDASAHNQLKNLQQRMKDMNTSLDKLK